MKNVMILFNFPGMTSKQYDQVWADLRAVGHSNPNGLLYHVGAPSADGWMVVDEWESEEHFRNFGATLMPILEKNNIPVNEFAPTVLPVHYVYSHILAEHY